MGDRVPAPRGPLKPQKSPTDALVGRHRVAIILRLHTVPLEMLRAVPIPPPLARWRAPSCIIWRSRGLVSVGRNGYHSHRGSMQSYAILHCT
jgi:hypothetical protein